MRRTAPGSALALALALALASCAAAPAGPAASLLANSGPLQPLRRLQKAGLNKVKCPAERVGCANCWQFQGENPITCGGCKRGYVYNFQSDACDCAVNYGASCGGSGGSGGNSSGCVCKKCGRVNGAMTSSPGGPIDQTDCTDNGLAGLPRSVGTYIDLDRECNDGPQETIATAIADVVGGADGVVPDSPVVYYTKCTNQLQKRTGVTTGHYSFRVDYLIDKASGGGGGGGGNAMAIAEWPALRAARRAARDKQLRSAGRSRAAGRLAAAYAAAASSATTSKTKDVLSLIKDGGICDQLTDYYDFNCTVKATGGAPAAPMNPGVPNGWVVSVPARGVADGGACPAGAALDTAVREIGGALETAVKALPGVTTVKPLSFIRCDVVGTDAADGTVVELWFNVVETHTWKSSPVTNVAAAASAASAAGFGGTSAGAGICADNALPMLCKLDGRVLGRLGYAYQDALRCARGAARRADPTNTDKVDVFTYAYDFPDATSALAGAADYFDPRPFVPLAVAQRAGGAAAAFDASAPAPDRGISLAGALKLAAAGVKGAFGGDTVKLIGTMMDGPVGTQFKDQTCPGYAEATAAAASQAWAIGMLSEVQAIELIASTPDVAPTVNTTGNSTSNSTTDTDPFEFLEVSLYVTNKNHSEPVTYADIIELVWTPGPHQQDPYAPDLNLIESYWYQRRRDQAGGKVLEMNQVPRLRDDSLTSYPTIDEYRSGRAYLARVPNAAGTAGFKLRSARLGNDTRVLGLGVGIASALPADPTNAEDPYAPGTPDPLPTANDQPRTFYVESLKLTMSKGPVDPNAGEDAVQWDHTIQFVSLL